MTSYSGLDLSCRVSVTVSMKSDVNSKELRSTQRQTVKRTRVSDGFSFRIQITNKKTPLIRSHIAHHSDHQTVIRWMETSDLLNAETNLKTVSK